MVQLITEMFPKMIRVPLPLKPWADQDVWPSPTHHPCFQRFLDLQKSIHLHNQKMLIETS